MTTRGERSAQVSETQPETGRPEDGRPYRELLLESIGGWRGMLDTSLPVVVFIIANTVGGLAAAIWSALAAGVVLLVIRLVRRETPQQAIAGFFGVAVAVFIASRTGEAKGFFLLGIWASFVYAAGFALSILVRWPVVGIIWEFVESGSTAWRRDRALLRIYTLCTGLWCLVFLARGLVQRFLYQEDRTGLLAVARLAMGYPLTLAALGFTLWVVRRVRSRTALAGPAADPDAQPATPDAE